MVTIAAMDQPPRTVRGTLPGGLGIDQVLLKTNRCVRSKLARPHRWLGKFWSPNVSAFPAEVELTSAPSVSRVLEKVYEARNSRPWLNRFARLTSNPLYQELPSDSISRRESAGIPGMGTRNPKLANVFEMTPLIGFSGDASSA